MRKLHVLMKKEELDGQRLDGKVVIVLDILFATTTIVAALSEGASEVWPALDGDAARALAQQQGDHPHLLAGELYAETLSGFAPATPLAVLARLPAQGRLIYATTNGTVALTRSQGAAQVYAAALLNALRVRRGQPVQAIDNRDLRQQISEAAMAEQRDEHGLPRLADDPGSR